MNILICDDEKYTRRMLEKVTSENCQVKNVFIAENGIEAIDLYNNKNIDIVLLDIDMPNLDGIETAKIINKVCPKTKIIFVTAHMEYALDSFCVHPYDYILKPIDINKLKKILDDLITMILKQYKVKNNVIDKFTIKQDSELYFISMDDILYFEKCNRKVLVHTLKKDYIINQTLGDLERNVLSDNFIRTHQSFIINKKKVQKISLVGNRSYEIEFYGTKNKAALSKHKYIEVIKDLSSYTVR